MDTVLKHLLENETSFIKESATWGDLRLESNFYLSDHKPPIQYVTSVRALVFRGDAVLVIRDRDDRYHVVPGGRREHGESLDQTLRREILEETRWTIGDPRYLGFAHYHHLDPKQTDEKYPHPDFCQLLYMAEAKDHFPEQTIVDDWVLEANLVSVREVWDIDIAKSQMLLLKAALRLSPESSGKSDNQ